ncbi:Glyoxalase/bleomycin resistance protein/dioxygenase [Sphingopyxis sp. LC81]|uniref:VOC family protein n=1 Tax=Sphingopyxis sp. LC81 TaxID=1502850 RepID=UPI00050D9CA6|nr:VOC family protein [Sphingopyxis sp. LC81]KGB56769.1 Glyoxalase/bleomycin resistance protein/dioxygenase [Sphingopyxis sp. LC81]
MEKIRTIAGHGPIAQIAWLTEDLDRAIDQWRLLAGVGPWTVYRNVTLDGDYRGVPATIGIDVGLTYQGETQIELIAPHGAGPSPYHDANGRVRVGMHHVAWLVDDVEAAAEDAAAAGLVRVFSAESGGGATRVAYLEAPDEPAILLELIEATPMIRDGFTAGTAAARDWDGSNPITIFDFAA